MRMEPLTTQFEIESFLNTQQDLLPEIGTSALDQILSSPSTSSLSSPSSPASSLSSTDMESRMSPDSTSLHSTMPLHPHDNHLPDSTFPAQPDSTTTDEAYDSDAFNSDDSCSSLAEVQAVHQYAQRLQEQAKLANPSAEARPSRQNLDLISLDNRIKKKAKKKKAKKAGDVLLKCEFCEYTTRYKEHLTSHMHTHATSRNYMCSDCGQTFKWSHSLKRHQRTHQADPDLRYVCSFCFKSFSRKDHLSIHENLHTSSGTTHPCEECGATFKNKKTLQGHMKTHSSQKKAFKCDQCESEFTRRASLNRHVKAAHIGQVNACPHCPAVFSYRSTLEDHKKAAHNEGKREFACGLCGIQFAVKAYLSKHMITCRNRAMGKSYQCQQCSKCYPTKRHLHEHEKRKHGSAQPQQEVKNSEQPKAQVPMTSYSSTCGYESSSSGSSVFHQGYNQQEYNSGWAQGVQAEPDHQGTGENFGSLLRLVYSCPESSSPQPGPEYHHHHEFSSHNQGFQHQYLQQPHPHHHHQMEYDYLGF